MRFLQANYFFAEYHATLYTLRSLVLEKLHGVPLHVVGTTISSLFFQYQSVLACLAWYCSLESFPLPYVFMHSAITLFGFLLSQQVMVLGGARINQTASSVGNSALT